MYTQKVNIDKLDEKIVDNIFMNLFSYELIFILFYFGTYKYFTKFQTMYTQKVNIDKLDEKIVH